MGPDCLNNWGISWYIVDGMNNGFPYEHIFPPLPTGDE
jgi:hypothetical protein